MTGLAIGINIILVLALVLIFANASSWLGPRSPREGDAEEPFETGLLPFQEASERMSVLYYRYAVLFVVFDVDLAFLLPWAMSRPLGPAPVLAMSLFVGLLGLMLAYFWRKGILEC